MTNKIDKMIGFWLKSKGFPYSASHDGYWVGSESAWYLWTVNRTPGEEFSVFLESASIWEDFHSCPCPNIQSEYDLRDPESLSCLERDIRRHLSCRGDEVTRLVEEFHGEAEGMSDSALRVAVRDLDEIEPGENPTGVSWDWENVKETMEIEMREIYTAELEWREANQLGVT